MSFQKFNQNDMSFIADTVEDLKSIPACDMGSSCYVIENASKYIINSQGEWICQSIKEEVKNEEPLPGLSKEEIAEKYISKEEVSKKYLSKEEVELEKLKEIKYEVLGLPDRTLIDYRQKEIRILIPEDAEFKQQQVGENGNPNMWYFQLKAYAPEGAVYFKEDDLEEIEDETLYTFEDKFAGVDKHGRKYSTGWLAGAMKSGDSWVYFGKNSTKDHMIGFFYTVEWYNEEKQLIGMDRIRINLTNKSCHSMIEPFYFYEFKASLDK